MRIAHMVFSFNSGGIENLLVDILNSWNNEDSVLLCIINNEKNDRLIEKIQKKNSTQVVCLGRRPGSAKYEYIKKLNELLTGFRPDVVHCHSNNVFLFTLPIKLLHPQWRFVLTIHDTNTYCRYGRMTPVLHRLFLARIIAISDSVKVEILQRGIPELKVCMIYNGVDTQKFVEHKPKTSGEKKTIICVSRIYPEKKGQDILVKAAARLKCIRQDFRVLLAGEPPVEHPEYLDELKEVIKKEHVEDEIVLLGNRNDVPELLSTADVYVMPSRFEGFGISLVEAMLAKVPVVASDLDGPHEIIKEQYGYLFEKEDDAMLCQIINNILDADTSSLTEKAYQYAREKFDIKVMTQNLREVYSGGGETE